MPNGRALADDSPGENPFVPENQDGLINVSQGVHRFLKANQVPHLWHVDTHGHDAEAWGSHLFHFAQRLFKPMG
jgi:enterochelin esterase-like enzyme